MVLNEGKKWATDFPLRKGMQNIHDVVIKSEEAFEGKTLTQKDGEVLDVYGRKNDTHNLIND